MWSSIWKNWKKRNAIAVRVPKFEVDGTGGLAKVPERAAKLQKQQQQQQSGDGKKQRAFQKNQQGFVTKELQQPVNIMAAAAKVAKRVPLIKFPNRKAGETQGAKVAVSKASGGGGQSQAMSQAMSQASLPSGTASSQPPRTKLTEAEIEAILLGGAAP